MSWIRHDKDDIDDIALYYLHDKIQSQITTCQREYNTLYEIL